MEENNTEVLGRRKFFQILINLGLKLLLLFTAGGGILMSLTFMVPPKKLMQRLTGWVPTVDKDSLQPGETAQVIFNGTPYFILRKSSDSYASFSAVCSHAACIVRWNQDIERFACPCHDSKFDTSGQPKGGPATDPLTEMALKIDKSGKIFIKLV